MKSLLSLAFAAGFLAIGFAPTTASAHEGYRNCKPVKVCRWHNHHRHCHIERVCRSWR